MRDPSLLADRLRRAVAPNRAFLEWNHSPNRTLLLVGTGRSGTTWLAEVLTDALHCRFLLEPLRGKLIPAAKPVRIGHYLDPDGESEPAVVAVLDRVLRGRIRGKAIDGYNTIHLPRSRLVKEVRATNLLPWVARRYPGTPVVYLLRHPVPIAWSVAKLGVPDHLEEFLDQEPLMKGPLAALQPLISEATSSSDPFHRMVLRWCLEEFTSPSICWPPTGSTSSSTRK